MSAGIIPPGTDDAEHPWPKAPIRIPHSLFSGRQVELDCKEKSPISASQKSGSTELELTVKKSQLASLLGTVPETLSRILTKMSGRGLIESEGSKIKILDQEGLDDLSTGLTRL